MDLDPRLNLLVGINGSGKTSVLNCIEWMLRPNFAKLASVPFKSIQLHFSYGGKEYSLKALQSDKRLTLSEESGRHFPNPITVDFLRPPEAIRTEAELMQVQRQYSSLAPEPKERKLWKFLIDLPHPLTVGLDRTISAETDQEVYVEIDVPAWAREPTPIRTPIDKVREVTRERYSVYRKEIFSLNEKLKTALVVSEKRGQVHLSPTPEGV